MRVVLFFMLLRGQFYNFHSLVPRVHVPLDQRNKGSGDDIVTSKSVGRNVAQACTGYQVTLLSTCSTTAVWGVGVGRGRNGDGESSIMSEITHSRKVMTQPFGTHICHV